MEFFNMKTKRKVDVPEGQVRKRVLEQRGSTGGVRRRYMLVAEHGGTRLFKFVSEQTFRSLNVPEVRASSDPLLDFGRPVEVRLRPIEDVAVPGPCVLPMLREVTERKRAEEERILLIREQAARAEAEAALHARDKFISVAAHELQTPITSVRGYAQLLRRHLRRNPPAPLQVLDRALEAIEQQAGTLAGLVEQLLNVSRIQAGRFALERQPTEVVGLVRKTVAAARLRTRRHTLVVRARPRAVEVLVDPLRLEQVLANLLDNALKYSPTGGEISVAVTLPEAGIVRLAVTDAGLGIPPEQRERVFERFQRAHADEHRSGLGLGLHVSRQIVEQHGGRIWIEAPPEGGTRVIVSLPVGPSAPVPGQQE